MSDRRVRRALVFGGTGLVGGELLKGLARAGVPTAFTFFRAEGRAQVLQSELGCRGLRCDLTRSSEIRSLVGHLERDGELPDLIIHAAARRVGGKLGDVGDEDWDEVMAVNCRSAFVACQALAPHFERNKAQGSDVVLLNALDRAQVAPIPSHFAAAQGAVSAMAMALAKELGPSNVRVNVVALGLLEGGQAAADTTSRLSSDYKNFSALRRLGSPAEAARAALWLALENTYMSGRVVAVNGGL